jgi:NAD(P)-dependent dehydrogenase (short-subunit alcohol dehydrogenase family)
LEFLKHGRRSREHFSRPSKRQNQYVLPSSPKTELKTTVLLTGPSPNSIGAETALSFTHGSPSILILTGRAKAKLEPLISVITSISPSTAVHFVPLDLSSQESVRNGVEEVKALLNGRKIDILIHSAGIMATPYQKIPGWGENGQTEVEGQFATNYVGSFLLVNLLIPEILRGYENQGGRVVLLSSSAHRMGGIRFEDMNFMVRRAVKAEMK